MWRGAVGTPLDDAKNLQRKIFSPPQLDTLVPRVNNLSNSFPYPEHLDAYLFPKNSTLCKPFYAPNLVPNHQVVNTDTFSDVHH